MLQLQKVEAAGAHKAGPIKPVNLVLYRLNPDDGLLEFRQNLPLGVFWVVIMPNSVMPWLKSESTLLLKNFLCNRKWTSEIPKFISKDCFGTLKPPLSLLLRTRGPFGPP